MKEDGNDDISHVLFSNKIDKSVYQSPFCTPLLIAELCRVIEALCFSVPAKQNSFSLINCNCCTYSQLTSVFHCKDITKSKC